MRRILAIAAVAATAGFAVAVRPAAAQSIPNITAAKTAATNAANATNAHTAAVTNTGPEKATPARPAARPAAQPAKAQPATAKPDARPATTPATPAGTKADAKGAKPAATPGPRAGTAATAANPEAKPDAKVVTRADAKAARAADQARAAAAVAPRDSAETIKVGASTNVARRGSASELTFSREVYSYPGRGRRDPFMSLLKSGDLRPLLSDLKLVTVLYDPTGRNSVAILRDLSTKPNDQYRVKLGQQLGRMRVAQIQPKQIVLTIEEFGYNRQEILALTSDSTRTR